MDLLRMSFFGAVLIIAIIIIRAVMINRLPKKTFIILWGIVLFRLLIPYTVPSTFSVYTLINLRTPVIDNAVNMAHTEYRQENVYIQTSENRTHSIMKETPYEQTGKLLQQSTNSVPTASITLIIWFIGMMASVIFFISSYLYWRSAFQASLPVQNDFVEKWKKAHKKISPVSVRQSDRIEAPLTYGIVHPVILMPKKTDWSNTEQLQYVLLHEYVHIRSHDSAVKLVSTLALCIHWFNPLVWVMYTLLQRDIELACDESVVRHFGEASKKTYANMLIDMETQKSGLMPLCNNFSKNAIEERIIAIMKIKKTSAIAILLSVILILGVTVAFATSASATPKPPKKVKNNNCDSKEQISFECMNEPDMNEKEYITGVVNIDTNMDVLEFKETPSDGATNHLLTNIDTLKVREGTSANAEVVGLLKEDQKVIILSEENGFYHISIPGMENDFDGWVRKEYVDVVDAF